VMLSLLQDCAKCVYDALGTGHTESVYHRAVEVELRTRGINYESKVVLPIYYRGLSVGYGEADIIVYNSHSVTTDNAPIIVELKAVTYAPRAAERAQIQAYMRGYCCETGLIINFRQPTSTCPAPQECDFALINDQLKLISNTLTPAKEESNSYNS